MSKSRPCSSWSGLFVGLAGCRFDATHSRNFRLKSLECEDTSSVMCFSQYGESESSIWRWSCCCCCCRRLRCLIIWNSAENRETKITDIFLFLEIVFSDAYFSMRKYDGCCFVIRTRVKRSVLLFSSVALRLSRWKMWEFMESNWSCCWPWWETYKHVVVYTTDRRWHELDIVSRLRILQWVEYT